jgi:hypothetical protein
MPTQEELIQKYGEARVKMGVLWEKFPDGDFPDELWDPLADISEEVWYKMTRRSQAICEPSRLFDEVESGRAVLVKVEHQDLGDRATFQVSSLLEGEPLELAFEYSWEDFDVLEPLRYTKDAQMLGFPDRPQKIEVYEAHMRKYYGKPAEIPE